ncbi:sugar ABC transporter ATP-binding protein [Mycetocola tolaasinivorans]|uniref:sugar ABC transporter ATP-binding protein n=1 Tax=Mycetocola tolaasinivorans TaxID=76635 RepID=UPI0015FECC26|nr:sugar ABC transporter ATP-binding protein [Mycetocola tolaasinivorans]
MSTKPPILEVRQITKSYPGVTALKDATLTLRPGEIRALLGENGAGKSTMIKIIGGLQAPTSGELHVNGAPVVFSGSLDSQNAGISVVSQEFRLVPQMTVAENIFLGHELTRGGLISRREQTERARELLDQLGLDISPGRRIDSLTVADQQLVEITRALSRDFQVLIMDEPTAALNEAEVQKLLAMVEKLRDRGAAILYVSHRLPEVLRLASTATVLRDGQVVADISMEGVQEPELVELMLGKALEAESRDSHERGWNPDDAAVLEVTDLRTAGISQPISFGVRPGQILGVAGLVGSGRAELLKAIFGAQRVQSGAVRVGDARVDTSSPAGAIGSGIFMLGEDRKAEGILPHLSVLENTVISEPQRGLFDPRRWVIGRREERKTFGELKEGLRIRVDRPERLIGALSGGNQQKVLFGRAVLTQCRVLLLNEPTRGVDVGAKAEIYQLIRKLAADGVAIVVSSSEAAELAAVSDDCLVLYAGAHLDTLPPELVTEDNIVAASLGQRITHSASLGAASTSEEVAN